MKSRYCPLLELHEAELAQTERCVHGVFAQLTYTDPAPGFAKSSAIRYSPHRFKSHRRLDSTISQRELDELALLNKLRKPDSACPTC